MKTMTPEERFERIERQLEFLAANQAHHDAHLAEIAKRTDENAKAIDGLRKRTEENAGQIGELTGLTHRIGRIVELQAGHIDKLAVRMDELAESERRTDARLNSLINVVERYFSNGHS
jgi:chromosome segregation ATPase